jgi:hypothetical protein
VDFILNDKQAAIKIKASKRVHEGDLKGLGVLAEDGPIGRRLVVSFESASRTVTDAFGKITVLPWLEFLEQLWSGEFTRE